MPVSKPSENHDRATTARPANRALRVWKAAKLAPITLHECRHTYVTLMHEAGFSLEEIGDYVGHGSSYMTDRYRHLRDGHEARAAERFDRYLTGPETGATGG